VNKFTLFFSHIPQILFNNTWTWWTAGLGIGLTAVALAWFTGKKLGVTGGIEDACSVLTKGKSSFIPSPSHWKLFFILGLPVGGFIATVGHLGWTLTYGRLDMIVFGSFIWKALWLLVSGFLIGFGARWAGGCVSGNSIMGVSIGSKMSILATVAFLVAGILVTNILFKIF
jgi:uncharacterized protein